ACPVGRFYPSVKRSPCFAFCVRLVCTGFLAGKDGLFFLLAFKRKRIQRLRSMCFFVIGAYTNNL
uniref:hypothetical protein n=1 Tax=Daejeonella sp. TaxID=2805397 RepID=UPI004048F75E